MLTISQRLTRYFWLSWGWGMGLTILVSVGFILVIILKNFTQSRYGVSQDELETVFLFVLMEGAGALAGNWLRQWLMRHLLLRIEAAATPAARFGWLIGGTLLLFVASVLFCVAVIMAVGFRPDISSMFRPMMMLFLLLSAPWLLTSPVAAWWVCRDWFSALPTSGMAGSK